jgi:plastocyanin
MVRFRARCTAALLALTLAAACAKDSPSGEQLVAPDASADAAASGGASSSGGGSDDGPSGGRFIAIRDDCDPRDPAWAPTGGCALRRGNVTFAEFARELDSPLALAVIGHQAWRNDPPYLVVEPGKTIRVRNEGGRVHTFTKVANFGGGKVPNPALNEGLVTAPECPTSVDIPPGGSIRISGLAPGDHRFECCIHPWMRALITVQAKH